MKHPHELRCEPLWKFYSLILMFLIFFSVGMLFIGLHFSYNNTSARSNNILAQYTLSGGLVGFCNSVIIFRNGRGIYQDSCRNISREMQLDEDSFNQLNNFSQQLAAFKMVNNEENIPDGLKMELTFNGQGKLVPFQLQKEIIVSVLNSIIFENRIDTKK